MLLNYYMTISGRLSLLNLLPSPLPKGNEQEIREVSEGDKVPFKDFFTRQREDGADFDSYLHIYIDSGNLNSLTQNTLMY